MLGGFAVCYLNCIPSEAGPNAQGRRFPMPVTLMIWFLLAMMIIRGRLLRS